MMLPLIILAIEDESDREFMARLFQENQRMMFQRTMDVLNNVQDAEDAMQTSLEKLIDKIEKLRSLEDNRRRTNYIAATCRNTALSHLRKLKHYNLFEFDEETVCIDDEEHLVESQLVREEICRRFGEVWPQLSERNRILLESKYILGKSDRELAEDFGMKPDSVRMALYRARNEAKKLLVKEMPELTPQLK